jgi:hypothetical protein
MENPYIPLFDWLEEEEVDIDAMIQAISGLQNLFEAKEKLIIKLQKMTLDLKGLKDGRKSIKSFFSFKSKNEESIELENQKSQTEKNLDDLENIISISAYNLDSYIEYFKVEKLACYYQNLKIFAELQKNNSLKINELWQTVGLDENVKKLI